MIYYFINSFLLSAIDFEAYWRWLMAAEFFTIGIIAATDDINFCISTFWFCEFLYAEI